MTATEQRNLGSASRNDAFVRHVRSVATDPGARARLRRSLRRGNVIGDDAWWLLGPWLPNDLDEALIMARVAAWAAVHHKAEPVRWRTLAGEIARAGRDVTDDVARRTIEGVTAEGAAIPTRIDRANRGIEMLPAPACIDWARMIFDLVAFSRGGERAHAARHRWYRDYHTMSSDDSEETGRNTDDD